MNPHLTLCSCKKVMSHLDPSVAYLEAFIESLDAADSAVVTRTSGMSVTRASELISSLEIKRAHTESNHPFKEEVLKGLVRAAQRLLARFVGKFYATDVSIVRDHVSIMIGTPPDTNSTLEVQVHLDFKTDSYLAYAKVVYTSRTVTTTHGGSRHLNGNEPERAFNEVISFINEFIG